jgi:iron complex transport system ATP-binding protein
VRLSAEGIVVRYPGSDTPALDGVSMEVSTGSLYAVLGPNGSGKSSLMRALLGLRALRSGRVLVDGREIGAWNRRELARAVGAVTQSESISFPLTTRELVAMGRYPYLGAMEREGDADRDAIERALTACDLEGLAERDVTTLSGGEFQRARLARALAQEPRALVLDEPTASLDVGHEMTILELLRSSADSGITVLLITHGLDMAARFADRMLLLSRGVVAAEGTPEEVLREDTLRSVYGWPLAVHRDPATGAPRVTPLASR